MLVGVRERVAAWRHRPANGYKFCSMMSKTVTDIVQSYRVSKLSEKKTHHVTPRSETPSLLVHPVLLRKFSRQVRRDKFTKLMQCAAVVLGRRYFFHTSDSLVGIRRRPTLLSLLNKSSQLHPVG